MYCVRSIARKTDPTENEVLPRVMGVVTSPIIERNQSLRYIIISPPLPPPLLTLALCQVPLY